ncbi:hypothetical protein Taro_015063 [Colocasia esculenta]|uniref:NADH dehydrogenase n=1 Tax=Colocasia esculenta TaxID=4460 RepID=A0A843UJW4_COLES|nr:hypothetical protein [Colocasia esculenta]
MFKGFCRYLTVPRLGVACHKPKVNKKLCKLERARFGKDYPPIRVAIVGCGYSGVELAATISERLSDKGVVQAVNVETVICPTAPSGNREAALKVFYSMVLELFRNELPSPSTSGNNGAALLFKIRTLSTVCAEEGIS